MRHSAPPPPPPSHTSSALLLLVALVSATPAEASVLDLFGYGVAGASMANTRHTTAEGHEAVYYNPANLVDATRPSFALGYQRADFWMRVNDERSDVLAAPSLVIGFGVPLPFGGWLQDRLALGMGFILPQTSILIADTPPPGELTWVLVGNRAQTVSIQAALAARLHPRLSIGAGFVALSELQGDIAIAPNAEGRLSSRVRDELVAAYSPVVGLRWRPLDALLVALVYRDASTAEYTLPITADLGDSFPVPVPLLDIRGTAQYDPRALTLELAWELGPLRTLAASASWRQWSAFPVPIVFTAPPTGYPAQPSPDFRDVVVLGLAAQGGWQQGASWHIPRAGVTWHPTPTPEQTGLHNHLDGHRLITGAGWGWRQGALRIETGLQWQWMLERSATKQCVTTADGRRVVDFGQGDAPTPPSNRSNPGCDGLRYSGHILYWGVELGVEL